MITRRSWGRFVLVWMLTLGLAHDLLADTTIVQTGRRRTTARESSGARRGARNREESAESAGKRTAAAAPSGMTADRSPNPERNDPLLQLAERAIAKTSQRYLDVDNHTPWQIMHGLLALRRDFELTQAGGKINCIEYVSDAPTFRGEGWWQVTEHGGRAHPFSVPYAFEGHANQFLALLSMSNLPLTHEIHVDDTHSVTMADMVRHAKMSVSDRGEITWTLWFLTHYVDIDEEWTNADGEPWSMERLVRIQTASPVINTPCGGCHGLYAIAYARNAYLQKQGRLRGVYFQVEQKLNKHIELARTMQNYDGSFSSEFFKGTGHSRDFNERLKASGHMLEWLMMALPAERLDEAWVRKGVASISTDLIHNASQPAECGALYHSLNSLIMFRDRARGPQTPIEPPLELAGNGSGTDTDELEDARVPMPLPLVEPDVPARRLADSTREKPAAEEPAATPETGTPAVTSAEGAEPTPELVEPTPTIAARPDPAELLARKAAQRLAGLIHRDHKDQPPGASSQVASDDEGDEGDDDEPPGLLRAPSSGATRTASEPTESKVR